MAQFLDAQNGTVLESLGLSGDAATRRILTNDFQPLGLGKPMTIKLMTLYAGDYKNGLFKSKRDMIVTSRIKPPHIAEAACRAVHQIYTRMPERTPSRPSAGNFGTALIYSTPAFVDDSMMVNLEFKIDNFKEDQMKAVGTLLTALGGIPLLSASAGALLLVSGAAVSKAAPLVNSLAEKKSWLSYDFDTPIKEAGRKTFKAGYHLIRNREDEEEFRDYEIVLINNEPDICKKGTQDGYYRGPRPYAVISINGAIDEQHLGFSPALASAAILQKFYGIRESGTMETDVKDLLALSSDYVLHAKIRRLQSLLQTVDETSDEYSKYLEKLDAYKRNLQTDLFRAYV